MLALGLDEQQLLAPEVFLSVRDCAGVSAAHRGGAGDGIRAGGLRDVDLDPDDGAGAVGDGWDAGIEVLAVTVTVAAVTGSMAVTVTRTTHATGSCESASRS